MRSVWELRAKLYDLCEASELRRGRSKQALFRDMAGRVLFVALGTGMDIKHFPSGLEVVAIDISDAMLRKARPRQRRYDGSLALVRTDALRLCFADASFDSVVTSCTLCSVPDALQTLRELYRVMRPGGVLLMFEHVRSRHPALGLALDCMSLFTRRGGTDMSRDTLSALAAAGFRLTRVESVFLDVILAIRALKPVEEPAGYRSHVSKAGAAASVSPGWTGGEPAA